jgi:circadian clock protein KaiC
MALAPGFREDFGESLYRMIGALTRLGVTIISTVEIEEDSNSMDLSRFTVSFLADNSLRMRYVSVDGQFRKVISVVKMRRSPHSNVMHEYKITSQGMVIGEPMRGFRALTSVIPDPRADGDPVSQNKSRPRPRKTGKRRKK